jgi:hypothetical protein
MWLPSWLGRGYAALYSSFEVNPFNFSQACDALSLGEQKARLILSRLKTAGY